MKETRITLPEVGLIAATRAMLGAGVGLLVSDRLSKERRKAIGLPLLAIGAASTIPLILRVVRGRTSEAKEQGETRLGTHKGSRYWRLNLKNGSPTPVGHSRERR